MTEIALGVPALVASDLMIEIHPRWLCRFRGTAEQLVAEGLIPEGFKWPFKTERHSWESGAFDYFLERCRPEGIKGPQSVWTSGDYWVVDVSNKDVSSLDAHLIHKKNRELAEIYQRNSPAGRRLIDLAWKAKCDDKYQAFRCLVIPEPKRGHGRPAKATTTQTKGPEV